MDLDILMATPCTKWRRVQREHIIGAREMVGGGDMLRTVLLGRELQEANLVVKAGYRSYIVNQGAQALVLSEGMVAGF